MSSILRDLFGSNDTEGPETPPEPDETEDYPRDVETVAEELGHVETAIARLREKREALQREREAAERARRFDFGLGTDLGYREDHIDALHAVLEELEARGHLTTDEFDRLYSDYFPGPARYVGTPHLKRGADFATHPSVAIETEGRWSLAKPVDAGDVVGALSYDPKTKRGSSKTDAILAACQALEARPLHTAKQVAIEADYGVGERHFKSGNFEADLRAVDAVVPPADGAPAWVWVGDGDEIDEVDADESRPKYDTGQADADGPAYGVGYGGEP